MAGPPVTFFWGGICVATALVTRRAYVVRECSLAQTRNGDSYLRLVLSDRDGAIDARLWDVQKAVEASGLLRSGVVVVCSGRMGSYSGQAQLILDEIRPALDGEYDPALLRAPGPDVSGAVARFRELWGSVAVGHLSEFLRCVFRPDVVVLFERATAAKGVHHAYEGGLVQHTVEVAEFCEAACRVCPLLNRDLLLVGALVHDIGKLQEYDNASPSFERTDAGKLFCHLVLGRDVVREAVAAIPGFPEKEALHLEHLVLSHHGQLDWGSPVEPRTLEAVALSQADLMSARLGAAWAAVKGQPAGWTQEAPGRRSFWVP